MIFGLRLLLVADALVLLILGMGLVTIPGRMLEWFHFAHMPGTAQYILAMWGCVLATVGLGCLVAATDPVRHIAWVQVGIARGALEALVGLAYVATGVVGLRQAWFAIVVSAFFGISYLSLYPKTEASARVESVRKLP